MSMGKRRILAALAVGIGAGPVAFGRMRQTAPATQILHVTGPLPSFEVVTIRPNHSGTGNTMIGAAGHGAPGDRFIATNIILKALICWAFAGTSVPLPSGELSGGPDWINSERYDIEAKLEDSQVAALATLPSDNDRILQVRRTLQSLLAGRFKLVVNDTTVTRPIYALVIVRGGAKLQETVPGSQSPIQAQGHQVQFSGGRGEISAHGVPISFLVRFLAQEGLDRLVVDDSGLKGDYDFELKWYPDLNSPAPMPGASPGAQAPPPDTSGPSIFTAIQEQLGLKLQSTKGPVEVLEIVHVEKPSEN